MRMVSMDSSKHLSLIDAGISDLWSLSLPTHLESVNLHGNLIRRITNLSHLKLLTHLDLSANQIAVIEGLDNLTRLKTLNLSCNQIGKVEGLSRLRALERLNLSYNELDDIQGLSDLSHNNEGRLSHVDLQGNKLYDVGSVVNSLRHCRGLRHLILSQNGVGNPLCNFMGYQEEIRRGLPQLYTVNEMDKSGRIALASESMSNIPGLESYLDYLLSSDGKEQQSCPGEDARGLSPSSQMLVTPKIDAVMAKFKELYNRDMEKSSTSWSRSSLNSETAQHTESMKQIFSDPVMSRKSPSPKAGRKLKDGVHFSSEESELEPVRDKNRTSASLSPSVNKSLKSGQKSKSKLSGRQKESNLAGTQKSRHQQHHQQQQQQQQPGHRRAVAHHQVSTGAVVNRSRAARLGDLDPPLASAHARGRDDQDEKKRQEVAAGYKVGADVFTSSLHPAFPP